MRLGLKNFSAVPIHNPIDVHSSTKQQSDGLKITGWSRALTLQIVWARFSNEYHQKAHTSETLSQTFFTIFSRHKKERTEVFIFNYCSHRGENYNCLLLNTVLLLPLVAFFSSSFTNAFLLRFFSTTTPIPSLSFLA